MGAYTCEFGIVHKVCRCPTPHTIKCNVPLEHGGTLGRAGISQTHAPCYRMAAGLVGKHEKHEPHPFWYTSSGGGHYMDFEPINDLTTKDVRRWNCPGNC